MPCSDLSFLVIEDHPFQRQMLCQLLLQLGARAVIAAASGPEGLDQLQDEDVQVDAVILDLLMPGMDGVEFMRHFRNAAPGMPLIVASALDTALLASVGRVAESYDITLLGLLQKPATAAKLAPMIDTLNRRDRQETASLARFSVREIADAWTRDEFQALYEPKVGLTTGAVTSVDLVPAWQHPTLGLLMAPAFMPCLEARGFQAQFQLLMLEQAFARSQKWSQRGMPLGISLALDRESLRDPRLVPNIQGLAESFAVDPSTFLFHISVREDQMDGPVLESLTRLRMKGFGIGLCNVANLAPEALDVVPFSEMRLPARLVAGGGRGGAQRNQLRRCVEAARQRKVRTVGTGLRSKDDWALLQECGCDLAQGPFVSLPIQGRSVSRWVQDRAASVIR